MAMTAPPLCGEQAVAQVVGQVDGSIPEHDLLSLLDGNSIERGFTKFKLEMTAEGTEDHQSETGSDQTNDRLTYLKDENPKEREEV